MVFLVSNRFYRFRLIFLQNFLSFFSERTCYYTMRAQQDATFATQLNDYNRQTKENENRNRDLRHRYDELMNDEEYKRQNYCL